MHDLGLYLEIKYEKNRPLLHSKDDFCMKTITDFLHQYFHVSF